MFKAIIFTLFLLGIVLESHCSRVALNTTVYVAATKNLMCIVPGTYKTLYVLSWISMIPRAYKVERNKFTANYSAVGEPSYVHNRIIGDICQENETSTDLCSVLVKMSGDNAELIIIYDIAQLQTSSYPTDNLTLSNGILCADSSTSYSDSCTKLCETNSTSKPCTGTASYCSKFGCTAISSCTCQLVYYDFTGQMKYEYKDDKVDIDLFDNYFEEKTVPFTANCAIRKDFLDLIEPKREVSAEFTMSLDNDYLLTSVDEEVSFIIILKKGIYTETKSANNTDIFAFRLGKEYFIESGTLTVEIFFHNTKYFVKTFEIVGVSECRFKDCIVCWDAINNFECLPLIYKFFVIMVLIFLALVILCFIPPALKALVMTMKLFYYPLCYTFKMSKAIWKKVLRPSERLSKVREKYNNFVEDDDDPKVSDERQTYSKRSNSRYSATKAILIVCLLLPLAFAQCSSSGVTVSNLESCVVSSENCLLMGQTSKCRECQATLSVTGTINTLGGSMCIELVDQNNSVSGSLEVTYKELNYEISVSRDYYTSSYYGKASALDACAPSEYCSKSLCEGLPRESKTAYGIFLANWLEGEGRAECSYLDRGCKPRYETCRYSVFGLWSTGPVYEVKRLTNQRVIPVLDIQFKDSLGVLIRRQTIGTGSFNFGNFSANVNGVFQDKTTFFGTKAVYNHTNTNYNITAYLADVSPLNAPDRRLLGAIQSNRVYTLTGNAKEFKYDPLIVEKKMLYDKVEFTFTDAQAPDENTKFPLVFGGDLWFVNDSKVRCKSLEGSPVSFSIMTSGNLKVRTLTNKVCPKLIKVLSAAGCHDCESGFTLIIEGSSDCLGGYAKITSSDKDVDLDTRSVVLKNSIGNITIYGKTIKKDNNFDICIEAYNKACIAVKFNAVTEEKVNTKDNVTQWVVGKPGDELDNGSWLDDVGKMFDDLFSGIADWWEYLIFAGLILIVIVMLPIFFQLVMFSIRRVTSLVPSMKSWVKRKDDKLVS